MVTYLVGKLDAALDALTAVDYVASPREQVAYDMFAASFFLPSPDACFVTLMMAVEALIEQPSRSERAQQLVADLIERTKQAGLDDEETRSLVGAMGWLRRESIGQGGRRLARRLEPRTYGGEDPVQFFNRCYGIRSDLVHGSENRPPIQDVNARGAHLQAFVASPVERTALGPLPDRCHSARLRSGDVRKGCGTTGQSRVTSVHHYADWTRQSNGFVSIRTAPLVGSLGGARCCRHGPQFKRSASPKV